MTANMMSLRRLTLALAALAGGASVALSGVAGWFLASAAIMGAAGPAIAHAFNFLAPSAGVRFFALTRTLSRYAERVVGHDAVLAESARLRPRLFLALARNHAAPRSLTPLATLMRASCAMWRRLKRTSCRSRRLPRRPGADWPPLWRRYSLSACAKARLFWRRCCQLLGGALSCLCACWRIRRASC